jgi:hypothetical protein
VKTRDQFKDDECLHNICNGIIADKSVNVDTASVIGQKIIDSMTEQNTVSYSFKKKDKAVNLGSKNSVKIADEYIYIDPMLLFKRLITAGERNNDLTRLFKNELSSYPTYLLLCLRHRNTLW